MSYSISINIGNVYFETPIYYLNISSYYRGLVIYDVSGNDITSSFNFTNNCTIVKKAPTSFLQIIGNCTISGESSIQPSEIGSIYVEIDEYKNESNYAYISMPFPGSGNNWPNHSSNIPGVSITSNFNGCDSSSSYCFVYVAICPTNAIGYQGCDCPHTTNIDGTCSCPNGATTCPCPAGVLKNTCIDYTIEVINLSPLSQGQRLIYFTTANGTPIDMSTALSFPLTGYSNFTYLLPPSTAAAPTIINLPTNLHVANIFLYDSAIDPSSAQIVIEQSGVTLIPTTNEVEITNLTHPVGNQPGAFTITYHPGTNPPSSD